MSEPEGIGSQKMLELATRKELYTVNEFLAILGIQNDQDGIILPEQLSRKLAEPVEREEVSKALTKNSTAITAATVRLAHEANRARRDIAIATATHKQLMLGIYKTMYQRKLKLEKKIQEEKYA